jgi:hypothetical protein
MIFIVKARSVPVSEEAVLFSCCRCENILIAQESGRKCP